jgi:uncharacterized DUF497 family protein
MIEFDPVKDIENRAKHGAGLALASLMFADESVVAELVDQRRDYGEVRFIAYGRIAGRAAVCVFTWRKTVRRIISLRKANSREQKLYFTEN